jgi:ketosteroid isomerase-like protein
MHPVEVVRETYRCFREQDLAGMEKILADDLVFTSPQDDHIDRATFFERCFPTKNRFARYTLLHAVDVDDHHVASVYEYELADGSGTFRNAELHTVRDHQVQEIQVFFGGRVR